MDLYKTLSELPNEWEREYEIRLTNLVKSNDVQEGPLLDFVEAYREKQAGGVACTAEENRVAYAAFYCLTIIYRTHLDAEKLNAVFRRNQSWCRSHETFHHLNVLRYLQLPDELDADEEEYLSGAFETARKYPENAGFTHAFADLYATVCERSTNQQAMLIQKWGAKARKAVESALEADRSYAKYYCTKGRILALEQDYDAADACVEKAIRLEDSSRSDYAIRIGLYQYHRLQIQAKKQLNASQIQTQIDSLKNAVISNIEILAFFCAVVSFIIGSLSLANGQTAFHAAVLILVLMGALLVVFSVFHFLLHLNINKVRIPAIVCAVIGALLVAGGIILVY